MFHFLKHVSPVIRQCGQRLTFWPPPWGTAMADATNRAQMNPTRMVKMEVEIGS